MAVKDITVCDVCGNFDGVASFQVRGDGRTADVDLCNADAAPLRAILAAEKRPARRRYAPDTVKVGSVDDIPLDALAT